MTVKTLFGYLIGQRSAIEEIAGHPRSLLIGFLLCLSAALARHYDGKYLVREPWFLLAPAGASIVTSFILFTLFYLVTSIKARNLLPGFFTCYRSFLGLYWMTAPLAWLYGIPYERFLGEFDAAQANVWTLELVSVWRVLLISRVVAVLTPSSFYSGFTKIAVPAFALFYAALHYARLPLINWMGGVALPPSAEPIARAVVGITFFGFFALIVGVAMWLFLLLAEAPDSTLEGFRIGRPAGAVKGMAILAVVVIVIFTTALPITQREQRLRYQVENALKKNHINEGLSILVSHKQNEFPPQWTPPPWPEYGEGDKNPSLIEIVRWLRSRPDIPEWVRAIYHDKAVRRYPNNDLY
jgi:hypothetical protein